MTSNENKISRMQDLIDRASNTVNNFMITTQNRLNQKHSRDHSRTNDVRDIRENMSRTSVMFRMMQVGDTIC